MLSRLRVFFIAIFAVAVASQAFAETRTVAPGKTSPILFYVVYDPSRCHYGSKPTPRVTTQPAHGKLSFQWISHKITDGMQNCNGKVVKGMLVTYTPAKGFHGQDKARFALTGSGIYPGAGYSLTGGYNIDITVK
jgi:hypothetical protein